MLDLLNNIFFMLKGFFMSAKYFLMAVILFHSPVLSEQEESLVIVPLRNGVVPEDVRNAIQSLGSINENVGFFIDNEIFVASTNKSKKELILGFHEIVQIREATQQEADRHENLQKGNTISVSSGRATLIRAKKTWGIFKVDNQNEKKPFSVKLLRFLKLSEFQKGDRIFILSNYLYNHKDSDHDTYRKQHLIMEVSNPNIADTEKKINLKESAMLNILKHEFHSSIAVNQRGEVIGYIELANKKGQLVKVTPDLITTFSELTKKLVEKKTNNGYLSEKLFPSDGTNKSIPSRCMGAFNKAIQKVIKYPAKLL